MVVVAADGSEPGNVLCRTEAWSSSVIAPSPVALSGNRIFVTAGYGKGSMLFEVREGGGQLRLGLLETIDKKVFASEQQTPIYYHGHLFGIMPNDAGAMKKQFVCYHPDRGVAWASGNTNRFGLGPYLLVNGKLLILRDDGVLILVDADIASYIELARAKVLQGRDAWAPMALVSGRLLLRDSRELVCLRIAP
jgi:outer membrane protein assembly factor BamB